MHGTPLLNIIVCPFRFIIIGLIIMSGYTLLLVRYFFFSMDRLFTPNTRLEEVLLHRLLMNVLER
jgi:hypothetical protein